MCLVFPSNECVNRVEAGSPLARLFASGSRVGKRWQNTAYYGREAVLRVEIRLQLYSARLCAVVRGETFQVFQISLTL